MIFKKIEVYTQGENHFQLDLNPVDISMLKILDKNDEPIFSIPLDKEEMLELSRILQEGAKFEEEEAI